MDIFTKYQPLVLALTSHVATIVCNAKGHVSQRALIVFSFLSPYAKPSRPFILLGCFLCSVFFGTGVALFSIAASAARAMTGSRIFFFTFGSRRKRRACDEIIQRNIKDPGHFDEDINTWSAAALFVHAYGAGAEVEFLGQLKLVHSDASAELRNSTG